MSAVDTVLKADKKRLQLLEEEAKLNAKLEAGDDSVTERLKQVQPYSYMLPVHVKMFVSRCMKRWRQ